jgi:NAD(P)-dependent dehydrogenase (short-subunit alcohol dehydrogenase family)
MGLLDSQVAVVTGASRGIGKAIAMSLGREGAAVVCTSRTTDASPSKLPGTNDQTVRDIEAAGGRAIALQCDVRQEDQVEHLRATTMATFGRCDILVNNAGISYPGTVLDVPIQRWNLVIDVNLNGPYLTTKAFAPHMLERGGTILNVSSGAARVVGAGRLSYSVSKAALDKLTLGIAEELRPYHINCISLGIDLPILTEGYQLVNPNADTSGWKSTDIAGEAAVWLVTHGDSYNGQVVTFRQLREDYKVEKA